MPTYQYACTQCDHRLEAVQSFSDAALTECPACSGRLRKVYGAVGVVFKGSGFYKTDSRAAKSGAKGESKGADTKAGADSKGDSKPDSSGTSTPAAPAKESSAPAATQPASTPAA